ncbi:P-loop NTPase [Clostridium psychrophilum]|uniref:P-loop NTPase n=1 Tax=Clostridium psychrophilum TaxID=132926 RepID=UPI001C0E69D1|nr:ATP-binding protein [Clostridium psychrophilum]MBU3182977.1 ATP-binding protein [Clostridium psychrophilum]
MNIAVLSGKGGTGKTTVSTNLALVLKANYIDCDVEEPNAFIFLKPVNIKKKEVEIDYPFIDYTKCKHCGDCANACQFNALAKINECIILFEKLCHSCGVCKIVCKYDAIEYKKRTIGIIEEGNLNDIQCKRGVLNIGEPMAVPIIKELLNNLSKNTNILDCSPGTSCNVVNTLQNADIAILVTEPSEFGFHDLKMAVELVKKFNMPMGIVINKSVSDENIITQYCERENISIIGCLPYRRSIAKQYSKGEMLIENNEYRSCFENIAKNVKEILVWN